MTKLNVNHKGVIGLVQVTSHLVTSGYDVFTPVSDYSPVDLIAANKEMALRKIQVKYREPTDDGRILFVSLDSVVNGKRIPVNLNLIDAVAIYCPADGKSYYIRTNEITGRSIRMCLEDFKGRKNRLAQDFLDPQRLW